MVRVALAQLNQTVGDLDANVERILGAAARARKAGAQILAAPELAITGYPPEDLVLKSGFVEANRTAVERVAAETQDLLCIVGCVDSDERWLYNGAAICHHGKVLAVYRKRLLPNYGVFDERRYFQPGTEDILIHTPEGDLGICVCEDVWFDPGPALEQADKGAQAIININASPFHKCKWSERLDVLRQRALTAQASIVYVNLVGGQDELLFDGGSLAVDHSGSLLARLPQFEEHVAIVDVPLGPSREQAKRVKVLDVSLVTPSPDVPLQTPMASEVALEQEVYGALRLALKDYVTKNHFTKVVIGLSGGIDSALTAVLAADALGPDNVLCVSMPSMFSTSHSRTDAEELASHLGIELMTIPIGDIYDSVAIQLDKALGSAEEGLAEENLQARIRGILLMFISNRYGHLVLATGNKSEMACGYATLYGDMAGGFALLKDVLKTEVYALARWRNTQSSVIPENILAKAPSAELRQDQKDSDSLPAYDVLDRILEAYVEKDMGASDIARGDLDRDSVLKVIALVDRAEYKRRQAPPGPKVTTKAFGRDRRLPITNEWREIGSDKLPARSVGPEGSQ
jgi:NAD+ synthase (glutamine-hydrolysing)